MSARGEAGGGEDVHDAFRLHGIVHQVADRLLDRALLLAAGKRLSQLIPHPLAEDDFVGVLPAVVEVLDEQKGGREPHLRIEEVVAAHLVLGHDCRRPVNTGPRSAVPLIALHAP